MATNFNWKGDWYKDRIKQAIFRGAYASALVIQQGIKQQLNRKASNRSNPNGSPSAPGEPPAKMTGHLGRSIQLAADINEPKVRIGTAVKYAPIHEYGRTITAKKRWLSIPVSKQAKRVSAQGQGPRDMPHLQFVRFRSRGGILVEAKGKGKRRKTIVHWILRKSVKIPKRPFFIPGFMASRQASLDKMKEVIQREMRRV